MTRVVEGAGALQIAWPDSVSATYARTYLEPLLAEGVPPFVANSHATLGVVIDGDVVLPFTVGPGRLGDSYITSPYGHYVAYGEEELHKLQNRPLEAGLGMILGGLGAVLRRAEFDKVVYVNNWLLSTNLYPSLGPNQPLRILGAIVAAYPHHAVVFRSVDVRTNASLAHRLESAGCRLVFSRRVLYQDPADPAVWRRSQIKNDLKLLRRTPYERVGGDQLSPADCVRIGALYDMLYLDKYSRLNPQFTQRFVAHMLDSGCWRVTALRREGRIDGVMGTYCRQGVMTTPLCGYDTALPQQLGLYRLLSMETTVQARDAGLIINDSAGVGHFKGLRGATAHREYNAVYDRHLPRRRRLAWGILQQVCDRLAVPIIERWDL